MGATYSHPISTSVCVSDSDCNPWLTPDEREMFFIRYSGQYCPADAEHQGSWDIYHAEWDSVANTWGPVSNLGPNVNTPGADRSPTTTADGDTLFFKSPGGISYSVRTAGEFGPATILFPGSDPCLSNDAQRIYYVVSNDIWTTERGPSGAIDDWVDHQSIGAPVNTIHNEMRPYITQDDSLLFFSDFGNPRPFGYGDTDLWFSRWTGSSWGAPENVGPPINVDRPACSCWLSADRERFYVASESFEGSRGCEDVWITYRDSLPPPAIVTDASVGWEQLGELDGAWNVYDITEDGDGTLYAATQPGAVVFRSYDDGTTWEATADIPGAMITYSLLAASDGSLYAGTYPHGQVFRSIDEGDTWTATDNMPASTAVRALLEVSDGRILAGTSPICRIYETSNGGLTWSLLAAPSAITNSVSTLYEDSGGILYAGGWRDPIRSTDGGTTWTSMMSFGCMISVESFLEDDGGVLWFTGWSHDDGGFVYNSTDGGTTWNNTGQVGHGNILAVRVYDIVQTDPAEMMVGYQTGPDSVACKTTDGGTTWVPEGSLAGTREILRFHERPDGTILAATTPNGDIFRYDPMTSVEEEPDEPDGFSIAAVLGGSPNPFSDGTSISYQIPSDQMVNLTIVDVNGRKIRTLCDEPVVAGRHELLWDGRDTGGHRVAGGVYFVRMGAGDSGTSVSFQKLVLVR